nr:hypothetical protein [Cytophagales bacterium]
MNAFNTNIDYEKIEDMVEGDEEFRTQLLEAIVVAVRELQQAYVNGLDTKKEEVIKQARHKIKPTLTLFGLMELASILGEGKQLIGNGNFEQDLVDHKKKFQAVCNAILEDIQQKLNTT